MNSSYAKIWPYRPTRRRILFLVLSTLHFLPSIEALVSSRVHRFSLREERDSTCSASSVGNPLKNTVRPIWAQSRHRLLSTAAPQSSSSSASSSSSSSPLSEPPPLSTKEKQQNHDKKASERNHRGRVLNEPSEIKTSIDHDSHRHRTRDVSSSPSSSSSSSSPYHQQRKQKRNQKYAIREMFQTAQTMQRQGRWGEARLLLEQILEQDPQDAHSHLALARLEARREHKPMLDSSSQQSTNSGSTTSTTTIAQRTFEKGTKACPGSVHLWQAWAIYEQNRGHTNRARQLFQEALALEANNPYVCHAYSLMEKKLGNDEHATELLVGALTANNAIVTAALVCSLSETLIASQKLEEAREVYAGYLPKLRSEKDRVEVYLASAWLEEKHFQDLAKAQDFLQQALAISPTSSLASVALARLEGRMHGHAASAAAARRRRGDDSGHDSSASSRDRHHDTESAATVATTKRLTAICDQLHKNGTDKRRSSTSTTSRNSNDPSSAEDGRTFNALATLEVKQNRFGVARDVLRKGMELYPQDHNLFTAAGKVEERVGNYTGARDFYTESLRLEPSAPTLVAFALLELRHPQYPLLLTPSTGNVAVATTQKANFTLVKGLFEEALLLDPKNGPAYNAYGNAVAQRGELGEARSIFERGVKAGCSDAASIYHGNAMLELSCGNVALARSILHDGLESVRQNQDSILSDIPRRDRAKFLSHTLGMLELNSNRPSMALEIFQEGIVRCGNSSQLLLGAALCEMRLGKETAARSLFERSLMADKKHAEAWQAWGVMETRAGKFKRSSAIFQRGIKHVPKHGSLWHGYATLELKRGNVMNARTLFAAGLKKAPRGQNALLQGWAILELREGNYQAARKLIYEALTKNKQNGRGWMIAAEIEEADGNDGLVSLLLRRGIECAPDDAELYRKLGEYLVGRGKINDAREVYEKGMELNPMYAPLYHSMAELEARICNLEALSRLNKRAAELFNNNALEPAPLSYEAFGTKIKATQSSRHGPSSFSKSSTAGVSALANKIVVDDDDYGSDGDNLLEVVGEEVDFMATLEKLSSGSLMAEGLVGDMISVESMVTNDTKPF